MFKLLIIIVGIAAIFCLYAFIACLFAMSRENELPDIEDVEVGEMIASEV